MAIELFANDAITFVTTGGTDAPASGVTETWTVASSASFPAASTGAGTVFHVADPAQPTEKILVTNVTGTSWSVTRGAESTTPLAHAAGFTVRAVLTAGWLGSVAAGTLDEIATANPPAAAWSNNSERITSLANGVNPQDAATTAQSAYFLRVFAV